MFGYINTKVILPIYVVWIVCIKIDFGCTITKMGFHVCI